MKATMPPPDPHLDSSDFIPFLLQDQLDVSVIFLKKSREPYIKQSSRELLVISGSVCKKKGKQRHTNICKGHHQSTNCKIDAEKDKCMDMYEKNHEI